MALLSGPATAQGRGILAGKVVDLVTGEPVAQALVAVQGTTISTLTNEKGEFRLELPAGTVSITIHKEDYYASCIQDIEVESGRITTYKCEMVLGNPTQNMFFSIGGITVLDRRELLPENIETTHEISSAEIEHQLSTNLGDILTLVPGVERTQPPGLSKKTQLEVRGSGIISDVDAKQAALFGTKIVIDDINISNNANLQTGTGTSYGSTSNYAGTGIDLRTIPADNIEKVEVVTGVPSAEYGDLTTGMVKVKTKTGRQPQRIKMKSNPDTKETNFSGGWRLRDTDLSYNLNYAYSERDIRREGDEYSRYNGQLTLKNEFLDDRLSLMNKFYYTGVIDETDLDPDDPLSIIQSNKDKTFIYGHSVDYKLGEDSKLEWKASVNYTKRDSYSQRFVGADTRVLTTATGDGTYEGDLQLGAYFSRVWTRGEEWNVTAKLNYKRDFNLLRLGHELLAGGEYTFDDNVGEGKIFNPLQPPYGNLGQRPLPYDEVPALQTANFYLEDEIKGFVRMRPWALNLGFRYEMYTPYKLHLDGFFNEKGVVESKNGTYFNPRIRAKIEPFDDTQIRLSWGKSSKMSSMTKIYRGPEYVDIIEENVSPPDSTPLVSTYVFDYDNSRLLGYQMEKAEGSVDQKIGPVALILTAYYTHSKDIPDEESIPITYYRYRWDNYPDPESRTPIDTFFTESDGRTFLYTRWYKNYGIEAQVLTKRIEKLSTTFRISAAYNKSRSGGRGEYMSMPQINSKLDRTIYPYYRYNSGWDHKVIASYSADWFIKRLGMWVTFFLQQTLFDSDQNLDDPYPYATGYFEPLSGITTKLTPAMSDSLGLTRTYDEYDLLVKKRPNDRVLLNINVSKSIGRGAEISFFVYNVLDDPAYYRNELGYWYRRNPPIFYGVEFSMMLDNLFRRSKGEEETR